MLNKRERAEYTMRLDIEPVSRDAITTFSKDVISAAKDAMTAAGQKYRLGGQEFAGEWVLYQLTFEGDPEGAKAALEGCIERVEQLSGTRRILKAEVRGPDGTL
jgi:hypothetical protein